MEFKTTPRTPKDKQAKLRKKRKGFNKWEKQFIKEHGIELYDKLRENVPELRKSPQLFRMMLRAGELFGVGYYHILIDGGGTND